MAKPKSRKPYNMDNPKKPCKACGIERIIEGSNSGFYNSKNPNHKDDNKSLTCKVCINTKTDINKISSIIQVVAELDYYFDLKTWLGVLNGENTRGKPPFGFYIRQIGNHKQYKNLTYDDSNPPNQEEYLAALQGIKLEEKTEKEPKMNEDSNETEIPPEVKLFWHGYKDDEIPVLELYYQDLISSYQSDTPIQKTLYKNIAATQFKADNAKSPTEYNTLMSTLSKLLNDANVKPVQDIGDNGLSTWGEWIKKIEETEPIPEPLEEFQDVDGILKYINKWFVGHLSKIFGVSDVNEPITTEDEYHGEDNGRD